MVNIDALKNDVKVFIDSTYVLRKTRFYSLFNKEDTLYWTSVENQLNHIPDIDGSTDICEVLDKNFLSNWYEFNEESVDHFAVNFVLKNLIKYGDIDIEVIKKIVYGVVHTLNIKEIPIAPILNEIVSEGLYSISKVKPIPHSQRVPLDIEKGQKAYFCRENTHHFLVSPCYIMDVSESDRVRIMYFTNAFDSEPNATNKITSYGFISVGKDEIGLTPEQAVQNTY